jgi:hypothetical protein
MLVSSPQPAMWVADVPQPYFCLSSLKTPERKVSQARATATRRSLLAGRDGLLLIGSGQNQSIELFYLVTLSKRCEQGMGI